MVKLVRIQELSGPALLRKYPEATWINQMTNVPRGGLRPPIADPRENSGGDLIGDGPLPNG